MAVMQGLGPLHPTVGLLLGGAVPLVDSTSVTFTCFISPLLDKNHRRPLSPCRESRYIQLTTEHATQRIVETADSSGIALPKLRDSF